MINTACGVKSSLVPFFRLHVYNYDFRNCVLVPHVGAMILSCPHLSSMVSIYDVSSIRLVICTNSVIKHKT